MTFTFASINVRKKVESIANSQTHAFKEILEFFILPSHSPLPLFIKTNAVNSLSDLECISP